MPTKNLLNTSEAENIASEVRATHGLGQKYRLRVEQSRGGWHVVDRGGSVDSVPPMPAEAWREYLEERFVEAITQHEETSEA